MTLPYISPAKMADYKKSVTLFAKGSSSVKCIRSHFFPEKTGQCDLLQTKIHEDVFVLSNRVGETIKVSGTAMQVIANIIDIEDANQWYEHLREQKRLHKERMLLEDSKREEQRKASAKNVVLRKKRPNVILSGNS